jgi:hypothetical protein
MERKWYHMLLWSYVSNILPHQNGFRLSSVSTELSTIVHRKFKNSATSAYFYQISYLQPTLVQNWGGNRNWRVWTMLWCCEQGSQLAKTKLKLGCSFEMLSSKNRCKFRFCPYHWTTRGQKIHCGVKSLLFRCVNWEIWLNHVCRSTHRVRA